MNDNFSELIRKISPTYIFFFLNLYTKSPKNSDSDKPWCNSVFNPTLNLETNSVGDKIWVKVFEVYDTGSPVGEVWQLNFYYGHWNRPHD